MSIVRRGLGIPHRQIPLNQISIVDERRGVPEPADGYGMAGYGGWSNGMVWQSNASTTTVTNEKAARLSAVFACWRLLTDAVSTLPVDTYVRRSGFRQPYRPRPDYLNFQPPQGSKIAYFCQVVLSLLADGNAFIATPRNALGVPVDLLPLDPTLVTVKREHGVITFLVNGVEYGWMDIMHIAGMMYPGGVRGISPIQAAREVIEGGLTTQNSSTAFAKNMAIPPALIEVPSQGGDPKVERDKAKRIAALWQDSHGGDNSGRVGVLVGGASLKTIAVSPEDSQWLETRKFSVSEIARIYGVPPHLIADATNSTSWGSGLAEQNQMFSQLTLQPLTERIEEGHARLLTTHGLNEVFIKFNIDAKLRSAPKERAETSNIKINNGSLTINEARAIDDMPPVPWGDVNSAPSQQAAPVLPDAPTGAIP